MRTHLLPTHKPALLPTWQTPEYMHRGSTAWVGRPRLGGPPPTVISRWLRSITPCLNRAYTMCLHARHACQKKMHVHLETDTAEHDSTYSEDNRHNTHSYLLFSKCKRT